MVTCRRLLGTQSSINSGKCKLDPLLTDLSTKDGGSKDFGIMILRGAQMAEDGSIEFFGSSFALPHGKDGEVATG